MGHLEHFPSGYPRCARLRNLQGCGRAGKAKVAESGVGCAGSRMAGLPAQHVLFADGVAALFGCSRQKRSIYFVAGGWRRGLQPDDPNSILLLLQRHRNDYFYSSNQADSQNDKKQGFQALDLGYAAFSDAFGGCLPGFDSAIQQLGSCHETRRSLVVCRGSC